MRAPFAAAPAAPAAALAVLLAAAPAAPATDAPAGFALDHVAVVDVRGGGVRESLEVEVRGDTIAAIGPAGTLAASGLPVYDAGGKYLIPGLWDMHVHVHAASFLPLMVAEGVTGVREMGDDPETISGWRDDVRRGGLLGPRIVMAGRILDGPQPVWPAISLAIHDTAEARAAVDHAKQAGWDFVKVYNNLPREAYFAIVAEARRQGLAVEGHVPRALTAGEASDAGQASIEHLTGVLQACATDTNLWAEGDDGRMALGAYVPERARALFARFARNGTWQCPTLVLKRALAGTLDPAEQDDDRLTYVPAWIRRSWDPQANFRTRGRRPVYFELQRRLLEKDMEIVRDMRAAGVRFLAGTDLGNPYLYPGFSLHDELRLLVQAGLTPLEALRAATLGPAEFLGMADSLGAVEPGKVADLVLLDANPLADIGNVDRIAGVCLRGRFLSRATREALLVQAAAAARR